jgi:hypothetical protein
MADVFLLRSCALCFGLFCICRRHDRGHAYCSTSCRKGGRQRSERRARAAYQRSPEGKADQRDRMRFRRLLARSRVMDQGSEKLAQPGFVVAPAHASDSRVESNDVPASEYDDRIDCRDDSASSCPPTDFGPEGTSGASSGTDQTNEPLGATSIASVAAGPVRLPGNAPLRCVVCGRIGDFYLVGGVRGASAAKRKSVADRVGSSSQQAPPRH